MVLIERTQMGCFNDLPKELKWMIFQFVMTQDYAGSDRSFSFKQWRRYEYGVPNYFGYEVASMLRTFSCLNKTCLSLIRSKCYKVGKGWLFRRGGMS